MRYQRQVIGYHGCLVERFEDALLRGQHPPPSEATFDWLGHGVYVWENGYQRALEWAENKARRADRPVSDARVLGVVVQLGNCLDFLDIRATSKLEQAWRVVERIYGEVPDALPENKPPASGRDVLLRYRDCVAVNAAVEIISELEKPVQSVRGCFQEGGPAFPGSEILRKSHIQVAVRDTECIIGYFSPAEATKT